MDRFSFRLISGTGTPSRASSLSCWTASRVQGRSAVVSISLILASLQHEPLPPTPRLRHLRERTRPEVFSPLVDPDHLCFGDDVGACGLPDLFDSRAGREVKPGHIQSREPELIMVRAVALGRLGSIIMRVAKVVHA